MTDITAEKDNQNYRLRSFGTGSGRAVRSGRLMHAVLSHYRILERIGEGGMGVVYRAHDERLDRDVALKVLPSGALADEAARKRFHKEALVLSKLNHPNIAVVHDFDTQDGTDFLVEELIPGMSLDQMLLSGPLSEREIVNLSSQLAEGLAAAHEQGVIHRDLKPANMRITPDGRLKILDFGLAKTMGGVAPSHATASLTEPQAVSGTLPYMAPEQLLNEKLDGRTDIWAAGCVLYEMATGQRPFPGSGTALTDSILHHQPTPPAKLNHKVALSLEAIILKCLEKDPTLRYASARDIGVDLRRLSTGTAIQALVAPRRSVAPKRYAAGLAIAAIVGMAVWFVHQRSSPPARAIGSIAVLPLANLSGDPQQEYFADGMTEALITELSQIGSLKVISRTSVMRYKGSSEPLPEIARRLRVDGVVEGSVLRSGDRVRITAQLIQAPSDTHLWAKSYERDLHEVLTLQSEVAQAIANEIKTKVTPQEQQRLASTRSVNPEAYELYLKGRYEWNKRTEEGLKKGLEYFLNATKLDPTYPLAYSGMADSYGVLGNNSLLPGTEVYPKAKAAALKALELDNSLAEAHVSLALVLQDYDRDRETARREYKAAIALNPNYATAHHWYAINLACTGRSEEAVREIEQARRLDPLSVRINANVAYVLYFRHQYDQSIIEANKALELEPNDSMTHEYLGLIYLQKAMPKEAIAEFQKMPILERNAYIARAYAAAGDREEALKILNQLKQQSKRRYVSPFAIATVYAGLGEKEEAFTWLQKGFDVYDGYMAYLKVEPALDPLRSDPRFQDLLRRMNLTD